MYWWVREIEVKSKKSKNRVYEKKYIDGKLERLEVLKQAVTEIGEECEDKTIKCLELEFESLHSELYIILQKLEYRKEKSAERQEGKLTKMASFDISMVGKNLQVFKGTYKYLEDFITQSELLHDLIKEEDKEIFVKYVYNFKLSTQVRSILGRSNKPKTFEQLKKGLEDAYPNPRTLQQVLTELITTKQNNGSIADFREVIAELSDQLSSFEIKNLQTPSQDAKDAIYKVSDSIALNIFMKGVNIDFQSILLSNMPKTFNEAAERCMTAEKV